MVYNIDDNFIDLNLLKYDLAKIYAKTKLAFALQNNCVPSGAGPADCESGRILNETDYLVDCFCTCYFELAQRSDEYLISKIDPTYEPDSE